MKKQTTTQTQFDQAMSEIAANLQEIAETRIRLYAELDRVLNKADVALDHCSEQIEHETTLCRLWFD